MKTTKENVTDAEYSLLKKIGITTVVVVGIGCMICGIIIGKDM